MHSAVFSCDKCGYSQAIDPVHIGSVFSCPTCGNVVAATAASPAEPTAEPPATQQEQPQTGIAPGAEGQTPGPQAAMRMGGTAFQTAAPMAEMALPPMGAPASGNRGGSKSLFGNAAIFVLLYILFMSPPYILPYLGIAVTRSLSAALAANELLFPLLGLCLSALALIAVTLLRALAIRKTWLALFPLLAIAFEFVPGINPVPYIPVALHVLTILLGVLLGRQR